MYPLVLLLILACPAAQDIGSPVPIPPAVVSDALGWWIHQGEDDRLRFLYRGNECVGWVDTEAREYFAWTGRVYYRATLPVGAPPIPRPPTRTGGNVLPFIQLTPQDCPT